MKNAKNISSNYWDGVFAFLQQPLFIIAIICILQLCITLLSNGFVLSFDESIWHYIGRNWLRHGMVPYTGGIDNKSPLIFLIYGCSDLLFGPNYWFPRLIGTFCEMIGLYFVFKIADTVAGRFAGVLSIPIYGLSLLWHATGGKYADFTETFEVMFLIIAIYRSLSASNFKDWFITGLWAGIALDFRITAAFGILAILLSGVQQKRSVGHQLGLIAGVITAVIGMLMFCLFTGIKISEFWTYGFSDNFGAGSATAHTLAYKLENFLEKFVYSPIAILYPLLMAYVFLKRKADLLIWWCALSFAAVSLVGIFDVVHLKDVLPALALTNAIALSHLSQRYDIRLYVVVVLLFVILFPSLSEPIQNIRILFGEATVKPVYGQEPYINPSEGDRKLLAAWVKQHTKATDLVLVHSYGTQIQCYSERLSPSVYFSINRTPLAKKRFYEDLNKNKPELILVPMFAEYQQLVDADQRQFVTKLIQQRYTLDTTIYNYKIYRLNRK